MDIKIRVRYNDVDAAGVVNNSVYNNYLEEARLTLLEKIGCEYKGLEASNTFLPMTKIMLKYLSPLRYGDNLSIAISIDWFKENTMKIVYKLTVDDREIATGYTTHVCTDRNHNVKSIPDKIIKNYQTFKGA